MPGRGRPCLGRRKQREVERLERHDVVQRDVEITHPRDHVALRVEARLHVHGARRAFRRARRLVRTRPLHPHRLADHGRDQRCIGRGVFRAVAAVAAGALDENEADRILGEAGDRREFVLHRVRRLRGRPHRQLAVLEVSDRAGRPDGGVRLHGEVVGRLDAFGRGFECRLRIADVLGDLLLGDWPLAPLLKHLRLLGQRHAAGPRHAHRVRGLDHRPLVARHDREEIALAHRLHVSANLPCGGVVNGRDACAVVIGANNARMQHSGHADVMDVGEFARHLRRNVDAADRLADHLVVGRLLQLDLGVDFELHAVADQLAVADRTVGRGLHAHHGVLHGEVRGRNAEPLRSALDERPACGGAGPAQLPAALEDREIRGGEPLVRRARRVAHHQLDPLERDIKLVGGELHERSARAGAKIDLADKDRDLVVGADGEPGVDRFLGDRFWCARACWRRRPCRRARSRRPGCRLP